MPEGGSPESDTEWVGKIRTVVRHHSSWPKSDLRPHHSNTRRMTHLESDQQGTTCARPSAALVARPGCKAHQDLRQPQHRAGTRVRQALGLAQDEDKKSHCCAGG